MGHASVYRATQRRRPLQWQAHLSKQNLRAAKGAACDGFWVCFPSCTLLKRPCCCTWCPSWLPLHHLSASLINQRGSCSYEHDEAWMANMQLFKEFTDESQGVRRLGAASVDLCHVAMGIVDAYWEYRLKPWDVCAGVLIVEEAGGRCATVLTAFVVV